MEHFFIRTLFILSASGILAPMVNASLPLVEDVKPGRMDVDCSNIERCTANNKYQVCGTNGETYPSPCVFCLKTPGIILKHKGPCKKTETCLDKQKVANGMRKVGQKVHVPDCNPDGSFKKRQCHDYTKFCWCVDIEGKLLGNSPTGNPDCTADVNKGKDDKERTRKQELCSGQVRKKFNKKMLRELKKEFTNRIKPHSTKSERKSRKFEEESIEWKFQKMDKLKDGELTRREYKDYRRTIKTIKPTKCAKKFPKMCDKDQNKKISLKEWKICFKTVSSKRTKYYFQGGGVINLIPRYNIKSYTPACRKEVNENSNEVMPNFYRPECTSDGFYKSVQCYGNKTSDNWYCFCVHSYTGEMIEKMSVRITGDQQKLGDKKSARALLDCSSIKYKWPKCPDEVLFTEKMFYYMHHYIIIKNEKKNNSSFTPIGPSTREDTIFQFFNLLDVNNNTFIDKKERKPIREIIKKDVVMEDCGLKIFNICDLNKDKRFSLDEWIKCISLQQNDSHTTKKNKATDELHPFIDILT